MQRQMNLVGFLGTGPTIQHFGAWRHPASDDRFLTSELWEGVARTLEEARFDAVFFADGMVFADEEQVEKGGLLYMLDPVPLASNVLRATSRIGVGITMSTSFFEPYGLARTLGTVDYLSGGRLAWNVVTSAYDKEAQRFGMERLLDRGARYDRATEVVEACLQLWDSFDAEALTVDKKSGRFIDPAGLTHFEYEGEYVKTAGPLTLPASPQGRPIVMQAGGSERGRQFAARFGEILFTISHSLPEMQAYYADLKERVAAAGRAPDDCRVLPLVQVVVAETEAIARERLAYVDELLDDDLAIGWTAAATGIDLRALPPDEPLAELRGGHEGSQSFLELLEAVQASAGSPLTLREAARQFCLNPVPSLVGTPDQVADQMQEIFEQGGSDGFVVSAPIVPGSFEDIARLLSPVLQERGLLRTRYPGTTLRETLRG